MQANDMITFHCPSCRTQLQVPAQMAGVTGPCPECSASITAPHPVSSAATPLPTDPIPLPPSQPEPQQPQQPQPQAGIPQPPPPVPAQSPASPAAARPTQPVAQEPQQTAVPRHQQPQRPRARWMRVVFPLAFVIVSIALVLAVLQAFGMIDLLGHNQKSQGLTDEKTQPATQANPDTPDQDNGGKSPVPGEPQKREDPEAATPPTQPDTPKKTAVPVIKQTHEDGEFPDFQLPPVSSAVSTSPSEGSSPSDTTARPPAAPDAGGTKAATDKPSSASPLKAGFLANKNLNAFLQAKTLDERLPFMSNSRHPREELMSSCLAGPLREVKSVRMVEMVSSVKDNMVQYLYFVSFEDPESDHQRQRIVMQVVERPGVHPPRVHGDAFIEHYEKKFTKFAKHPNKELITFHCIAEARTADLAKGIPKELKPNVVRLIIRSHPYGAAMFDAYLSKKSPLMEHIGPRKEFPYTETRFCILSFRWNTSYPGYPYIELTDIACQGWER